MKKNINGKIIDFEDKHISRDVDKPDHKENTHEFIINGKKFKVKSISKIGKSGKFNVTYIYDNKTFPDSHKKVIQYILDNDKSLLKEKTFKPTLKKLTKMGKKLNKHFNKELTKQSSMQQVQKPNIKIKEDKKDDFAMKQSGYNDLGVGKLKTNRKKDLDPSFQNFKHLTYESLNYIDESDNVSLGPIKRKIRENKKQLNEQEEFIEHDLVVSIAPIKNIPIGTDGTIVHVYSDNEAFAVEFFDKNHQTIEVKTVLKNQIQKRKINENKKLITKKELIESTLKEKLTEKKHLKENREISYEGSDLALYAENDYDTYNFVEGNRNIKDIFEFALNRYEKEIGPLEYGDKETLFYEFANEYVYPEEYQEEKQLEETTTSSSSGQYQTPFAWAPNKKGWANAKKRWWGENSPNTGGSISKGGVVNIKDSCKGYSNSKTQCNSGDIGNITITEEAQNLITKLSKEYNKPVEYIKNLIKEDHYNKVTSLKHELNNITDEQISQFVTKQLIKEGYLSVDELKQTKDNWRGEGCKNYDDSRDICLDKKVNELYLQDRPIYKHKKTGEVWEASEVGYRDITLVNLKNPTMIINVDKEELKNEYIKLGSGLGENTGPDTSGLYGSYKDVEGDMSLMSPDITENKLK